MGHLSLPGSDTKMCIYTITNKVSGKTYVGQTIRLAGERWYKHVWAKEGSAISLAIAKYGVAAFEFAAIDNAETIEQLNYKEEFWIEHYDSISPNGYNLIGGGNNRTPSEETRLKQAAAKQGKPAKPEHVAKRAAALRALYAARPKKEKPKKVYVDRSSDEYKKRMSAAKLGKRPASRARSKTNRTGKSGIFFRENHGSAGAYSAHAMVDGKMKSKTFGCLKRGKEEAFRLACEWRNQMERTNGLEVKGNLK